MFLFEGKVNSRHTKEGTEEDVVIVSLPTHHDALLVCSSAVSSAHVFRHSEESTFEQRVTDSDIFRHGNGHSVVLTGRAQPRFCFFLLVISRGSFAALEVGAGLKSCCVSNSEILFSTIRRSAMTSGLSGGTCAFCSTNNGAEVVNHPVFEFFISRTPSEVAIR